MAKAVQIKARQLIDGASFGPEALKAIGEAFDKTWAEISANFGNDPVDVEKARLRLAKALLDCERGKSGRGGPEARSPPANGA
jgi:hypothetical protein